MGGGGSGRRGGGRQSRSGVVCCWTGTGASIAANKVPGIRAALCGDAQTAAGARRWNDANVLALSLRVDVGGGAGRDPRRLVRIRCLARPAGPGQCRAPRRDRHLTRCSNSGGTDRPVTLHVHRAERADRLAAGLAELLADPLRRRVRRGGRRGAGARGRAVADPAAVAPARAAGDGHVATASALACGSRQPAALIAEVVGRRGARPVGAGQPGLAAARGDRRIAPASPGAARFGATSGYGMADRRGRSAPPRPPVRRRPPARRAVRRVRDPPARRCSPLGGRRRHGRLGEPLPPDLAWQAGAVAPAARPGSAAPDPVERLDRSARRAARRSGQSRAAGTAVAVRRDPAAGQPAARCSTALAEHRDVHCGCRIRRPSCGTRDRRSSPAGDGRSAAGSTRRAAVAEHPLLSSLGRDARELQLVLSHVSAHGRRASPARRPTRRRRCSRSCSAISATTADRAAADSRCLLDADDHSVQVHACHGAGAAGRRAARGAGRAAGRRRHAGAARRPGDVPRHRGVRPADLGARSGWPTWSRAATRRTGCGSGWPTARSSQTNPLLATVARLLELADGRVTASQVLDLAAWPPVRRRFGFDDDDLEQLAAGWPSPACAGGSTPRTAGQFGLRRLPAEHLAGRARPDPARRRDGRRGPQLARPRAAARRRRQLGRRPGRPVRRAARPARHGARRSRRRAAAERLARRADRRGDEPDQRRRPATSWQSAELRRELAQSADERRPKPGRHARRSACPTCARCSRGRLGGRPDPGELPHRHADRLHDGADALGAAPGGLPARAGRRRLPARRAASTATTCSPATRRSASATRAARTAS